MPELLVQQVLQAVQTHPWIRRVEYQVVGKVARLRLFLADDRFVAVYYNAQTGSISYAYIEGEQRLLGANNMKIGWHIHPYGQEATHIPSQPVSIEAFLRLLEKALSERGKLG